MTEKTESLKHKTVKGSLWSFADNILGSGIMFLVGLVLARLLTPHEYGLIGIITIFIAISTSLVDSGFSNALIRKKDASNADFNTVFLFNFGISALLFCILYFTAPFIGSFFNEPLLIPLIRVMGVVIIINAFAIIQRTILVKAIDFKTQTKVSFIASVSSGVIGIGMALLGYGVWSLVWQQMSRQLLITLLLWKYSSWFPSIQFSRSSFNELFGFGWKLMVSGLIDTVWREVYQVVIGKCYSSAILGQYTRAQQFATLFSSNLLGVVMRVTYPVLSNIQDDKQRLKEAYRKIIRVTMLLTFTLMLGLGAVAKSLVIVLIGEQWLPCVPLLQIICFSYMLYPLHALNLNMLEVQGRSDLFLKIEIVKKIVAIGPILLGVFFNIYVMLFCSVLTGFFAYYLNAYYSGTFLQYSFWQQVKDILPSFGVAMLMFVIVSSISFIPLSSYILLPVQIVTGILIVVVVSHLCKLEEYLELKSIVFSYLNKNKK